MKSSTDPLLFSKYVFIALLVATISFSLIRFVHIDADFPEHITTSGALYTDEGWYAGSAIRQYLTGSWYLAGDINTAVTQPGGQLLYRLSFAIFGLSLFSVRVVIIVTFLLFTLLMSLWIRNYHGNFAALLTALILSTNFFAFAYSRLALRFLIALCFVIASFWVMERVNGRWKTLKVTLSALLLVYAILTYTTAVFALPLLLFIAWKNGRTASEKLQYIVISLLIITIVFGTYYLLMKNLYPMDVANDTNRVSGSLITSFTQWPRNLAAVIVSMIRNLGPDFAGLTALLTLIAFALSKTFRSNPLVRILIGYIAINIAMLSINTYGPPRYYLMLLAPFAGLLSISCITIIGWLKQHHRVKIAFLPALLVIMVSLRGAWSIVTYLSNPQYSFYQMAQGVKNIIQEREKTTKGILLFGDLADSVSLEAGTTAVNNGVWTISHAAVRLEQYRPKYLIVHTSDLVQVAISQGARVSELGRWDVFNNYYANGEQVRLYVANWP